jgi:hypothetical protein
MRISSLALAGALALVTTSAARADDPAPPPAKASVLDTLPFASGPLPGAPGLVIKTRPSTKHCGGTAISATVKKSRSISAPDPELAAVFVLAFPTKLDFDPKNADRRRASLKKFDAWFEAFTRASTAANEHYSAIVRDPARAPADRIAAAARVTLAARWAAHVIARAPIPAAVAKIPEAAEIYCDTLLDKGEPLSAFADDAARACRDLVTSTSAGDGWWTAVCAGP